MRFNPIKATPTLASTDITPPLPPLPAAAAPPPEAVAPGVQIKPGFHTKRQVPIWIVQLTERVSRKDFLRLAALARKAEGNWSSYGPMDQHGFLFYSETAALGFALLVSPSGIVTAPPAAEAAATPAVAAPLATATPMSPSPMPAWRARLLRRPFQP